MHTSIPAIVSSEPEPALLSSLSLVKRISLVGVSLIALLSLAIWSIAPLARFFPPDGQFMNADAALSVLLNALALHFSNPDQPRPLRWLSLALAATVALLAAAVLVQAQAHITLGIHFFTLTRAGEPASLAAKMSSHVAIAFALLAILTLLQQVPQLYAALLADSLAFLLTGLVLILGSEYLFSTIPQFGLPSSAHISPLTLICLFLLTLAALLRRTGQGPLSILIGSGIGSRFARCLTPVLLLIPFVREVGRVHIVSDRHLPANYAAAILASIAAMLSVVLLLFIAWRFNAMEREIQNLSLRDELTGLYNLRGFHILAEQALRLARRSQTPFSVLFIDLDNLKQINDAHGHSVGSATLTETGQLLGSTFRGTDVLGRIGGDEFAVAGQFSHSAIAGLTQRLREASAHRNQLPGQEVALTFSIGHVTAEPADQAPLRSLLARADEAMYEEKRRKKSAVA
jgi:diguanylate cyclase (GGDEF)-like protein